MINMTERLVDLASIKYPLFYKLGFHPARNLMERIHYILIDTDVLLDIRRELKARIRNEESE